MRVKIRKVEPRRVSGQRRVSNVTGGMAAHRNGIRQPFSGSSCLGVDPDKDVGHHTKADEGSKHAETHGYPGCGTKGNGRIKPESRGHPGAPWVLGVQLDCQDRGPFQICPPLREPKVQARGKTEQQEQSDKFGRARHRERILVHSGEAHSIKGNKLLG